jgi:hypothetical protein
MPAITISVTDVNGEPVRGCRIEVSDDLGNRQEVEASANGEVAWTTLGKRVHVVADHESFVTESMNAKIEPPVAWDLPTARLRSAGASLEFVIVLSRLVPAPTYEVQSERLRAAIAGPKTTATERAAIEKQNADKLAALRSEVHGALSGNRIGAASRYLWMKDEFVEQFVTVDVDKNRRRVLTTAKGTGWARFVTKRSKIDINAQGQFWLLEYGGSLGRRRKAGATGEQPMLVAVYIPDLEPGPAPTERDLLVFLAPNTAKLSFNRSSCTLVLDIRSDVFTCRIKF